ncbi:hypothetical protein EC991_000460 [Linnemannia zychae]|nr:hypothetical protein EC991_000460 [Linnemannia zychae]
MGLDSLTQQYAAITLSATPEATPSSSAFWTVFSIPELVDAIAPYLNTSQRSKLCLVSKLFYYLFKHRLSLSLLAGAFHDPPFGPPGSTLLLPDIFRTIAPRAEAMVLDLHSSQEDRGQNAMLEALYKHSAVTLRRLRVSYWGAEPHVLEEVITKLPNLEELSVSFKSSAHAVVLPKMLIRVAKARQAAARSIVQESSQQGRVKNDGCGLRVLAIELVVPESKELNMSVLGELLKVCPALVSLTLTSFSLDTSPTDQPLPETTAPLPPPLPSRTNPAPPIPPMLTPVVTGASSGAVLLALQHQGAQSTVQPSDLAEELSLPRMRSLQLIKCPLLPTTLWALDKLFPRLQELQLTSCPGGWYREMAGVRTSQITPLAHDSQHDSDQPPDVPFIHLRSLRIWVKEQTGRDKILGLFKHRPGLISLQTDILPDSRDGLLEVAAYCSGVAVDDLVPTATATSDTAPTVPTVAPGASVSVSASASAGTTDMSKVRNRIKRLALQTYSSPAHDFDVIKRFYNAPAFRELEYVYMQNRELSMALFPFAKTLRELNLGGPGDVMRNLELTELNYILHQLPVLRVLKIDRDVNGGDLPKLFRGFGPGQDSSFLDGETSSSSTNSSDVQGHIPLPPQPSTTTAGEGQPQPLAAVLDQFEGLEKVTIRVGTGDNLPKNKDILRWREMVLEDKKGFAVTGCKMVFKVRKVKELSVVM